MNVGTKSVLWGAHAFWFHPVTVFLAWCELYGLPNWKECICILIHDWGYWGKPNMDGVEGSKHPIYGANLAHRFLDKPYGNADEDLWEYHDLCYLHSRGMAKDLSSAIHRKVEPSKLCWADKLAVKYDPWFIYLPRAILSGEIAEYRKHADEFGELKSDKTNKEWYTWAQTRMIKKAYNKDTTPPYEG